MFLTGEEGDAGSGQKARGEGELVGATQNKEAYLEQTSLFLGKSAKIAPKGLISFRDDKSSYLIPLKISKIPPPAPLLHPPPAVQNVPLLLLPVVAPPPSWPLPLFTASLRLLSSPLLINCHPPDKKLSRINQNRPSSDISSL